MSGLRRILRSLAHRNFRLYITGHAVSVIGTWMQRVAQDWLVLQLTGRAVDVGIATALQFLPTLLFGLWGGVLVDRLDRRRIIIVTQACSAVLAAALAGLVLGGVVEVWMVFALALALGVVTVVDGPARQAFVAEVVGPANYVNGQALASTVHNCGRLLGPAAAGTLIAAVGSGVAFALNAVSFLAVIAALLLIRPEQLQTGSATPGAPARGQVAEGVRYVWSHPELRACMVLVLVVALFGQNFRVVLPVLAQDTFHGGPELYGWLTSALGLGAVAGAMWTASRESATSWALLLAAASFGVVNLVVAVSPWLGLALAVMVGVGATNIAFNTLARTLLQLNTDPSMHGRVMALHSFVFLGTTPIGGPAVGWLCEQTSPRWGMAVAGISALTVALFVLPRIRALRAAGHTAPAPGPGISPRRFRPGTPSGPGARASHPGPPADPDA